MRRGSPRATALAVAALCAGTGVVAGVLWSVLAPRATWRAQDAGAALDGLTNQAFIGADGTLGALCLGAGALTALAGSALGGRRPVPLLAGLVAGGLLGAVLAWRTGVLLAPDAVQALARERPVGTAFEGGLRLRAPGVLLLWPIAAAVVVLAVAAGRARRSADPGAGTGAGPGLSPDDRPGPPPPG